MNLDIHNLLLVTIYVEAILGLLLLFAWAQNTAITAVAWWGFAHLLRAASVTLFGLYGSVSNIVSIDLANAILFTSFAVTWTGARLFDHRKPELVLLFAGAALWLVACQIPGFSDTFDLRALVSSCIIAAYTWAAAFEFWRGRSEPLVSRWPAIGLLVAHGTLYLLRTPVGSLLPLLASNTLLESVWLSALSVEALLFTIAIAFIFLAMAKERAEHRHNTAARIDSLTGISNRQVFLQEAEEHFSRQIDNPRPTAVMLLDLDNFKSINDRYGRAIGDQVLETFAKVASSCLRRIDLLARLGGEEFAALLNDTPRDRALAVADQIRCAFASATREVEGLPVAATVSIGIVVAHDAVLDLPALLVQADHALYRAKQAGRNRIEIASIELFLDRANRGPTGQPKAKTAP
jgi:diguanylate cyclase (GGDEF)-like protein